MSLIDAINSYLQDAGITVNGKNPQDIQIHDKRFYQRVLRDRSLGAGESYVEGWWDCERLDEFFIRIMRHRLDEKVQNKWRVGLIALKNYIFNFQTKGSQARKV